MRDPRIRPVPPAERDDEAAALIDAVGELNLFTTMANHPKLFKRWMVFGGHVLAKNSLPARERELIILRVGWRCGSEYEFGQHTLIARRDGLTDDEIRRLATPGTDGWSDDDAAFVDAVDARLITPVLLPVDGGQLLSAPSSFCSSPEGSSGTM